MKILPALLAALLLTGCTTTPPDADGIDPGLRQRANTATLDFREDPRLARYFEEAHAWVVFPGIIRGGFGWGGAYGLGLVYARDGEVLGRSRVFQGSAGVHFGGQQYRQVIFFRDEARLLDFMENRTEFVGQANIALANLGGGMTPAYNQGVAVFTQLKGGLMVELSVSGHYYQFRALDKR